VWPLGQGGGYRLDGRAMWCSGGRRETGKLENWRSGELVPAAMGRRVSFPEFQFPSFPGVRGKGWPIRGPGWRQAARGLMGITSAVSGPLVLLGSGAGSGLFGLAISSIALDTRSVAV
jgi:hypothetical protein